jgi:hypothetical protein
MSSGDVELGDARPEEFDHLEELENLEAGAPVYEAVVERQRRKGFLSRWVEHRAEKAITRAVSSGAQHIEQRAAKVVGSLYEEKASDLEERAVRALRRAIEAESERIQKTIEHAVEVKRREVRLSLLVLVGAAIVYLALYWLTHEVAA